MYRDYVAIASRRQCRECSEQFVANASQRTRTRAFDSDIGVYAMGLLVDFMQWRLAHKGSKEPNLIKIFITMDHNLHEICIVNKYISQFVLLMVILPEFISFYARHITKYFNGVH